MPSNLKLMCPATPNAETAALAIGKMLSRARWHLSQGLFVDDAAFARMPEEDRLASSQDRWQTGQRAILKIRQLAPQLAIGNLASTIEGVIERITVFRQNRGIMEAFQEASAEARRLELQDADRTAGDVRIGLVRGHLFPLLNQVHSTIQDRDPALARWLRLGRLIDSGLCRPDVVRWLDGGAGALLLRADTYQAWLIEQARQKAALEGMIRLTDTPSADESSPLLSTGSRDPGHLMPERFWVRRIQEALADFDMKLPEELEDDLASFDGLLDPEEFDHLSETRTPRRLRDCTRNLYDLAARRAGGQGGRVFVDHDAGAIWVDGQKYSEGPEVLRLFDLLSPHIGREDAVSLNELLRDEELFPGRHKWADLQKLVAHKQVRDLIHSRSGKGTWRSA